MALVSMLSSIPSLAMARGLFITGLRSTARIAGAVAATAALTWCVATAATIPAVANGKQTLVAVEPLLQSLEMAYTIENTSLDVDGRRFPQPLVDHGGVQMADAAVLARFLHLDLTRKNGVLVFSSPQSHDAAESAPPPAADLDAVRDQLLAAINEHRRSAGRSPLHVDPIAQQAAQYQADDMARTAQMRHEDAKGRTPMERYSAMGGRSGWYAENVGWYGLDVWGVRQLWTAVSKLDSQMMAERPPDDGHRENILATQYDAVGIGVSVGPRGLYLAEDFSGP